MNNALLVFLESFLGKGYKKTGNNYAFHCPKCHHHKNKLEVDINTNEKGENKYYCWTCGDVNQFKGKTIKSLLYKLGLNNRIQEANTIVKPQYIDYDNIKPNITFNISLPTEFISLNCDHNKLPPILKRSHKQAQSYLIGRKITQIDIIKYNIGFCYEGRYKDRIIIPSYDDVGMLNGFVARNFTGSGMCYLFPEHFKKSEIIPYDYYINWNLPIILVEGVFDMLAVKRNCIPLLGKTLNKEILKKIIQYSSHIYIALDTDARKEALAICEKLIGYGKKVYLVEIDNKDFSSIGFEESINILRNTIPLDFELLIDLKLDNI